MSTIERDHPPGYGSISNKRPKRKSEVWLHFDDSPDGERAICRYCGKSFCAKKNMGTSHLKRHIGICKKVSEDGTNQTPIIDWEEDLVCNIGEDSESGEKSVSNMGQKRRSEVWDHFQKTPDCQSAICEHCGKILTSTKYSGTSHLKRHLEKCEKRSVGGMNQPVRVAYSEEDRDFGLNHEEHEGFSMGNIIQPLRVVAFNEEKRDFGLNQQKHELQPLVKMAIMAKIPLLSSDDKKIWRSLLGPVNFETEVCGYYQNEKKKLAVQLKHLTSRVSFTCEITGEIKGYCSMTAFFIDDDFNLVKRLIGFKKLNDSGIVAGIESCISDWKLEDKVFTFTLAPGLDQSDVIDSLKAKYSSNMLFDGQYIHVPCCRTTVVDFIDHYIYSFVLKEGRKIREFFETLTSIPSRMSIFNKLAMEMGFPPLNEIWLEKYAEDLDSVVIMLKDVILYKDVFSQYVLTEIGQWHFTQANPCCINWKRVELAVQLIVPISDTVNGWSNCQYPTANLYFRSFLEIGAIISSLEKDISEIEVVHKSEAGENHFLDLKDAIVNHLSTCNVILFIACVLDPRFKLVFLEYCFEKIFESNQVKVKIYRIRECLRMFFDEYAQKEADKSFSLPKETTSIKQEDPSTNSTLMCHTTIIKEFSLYKKQVKKTTTQSELDEYLNEDVVDVGDASFDLLGWWKQNRLQYPVLARIARDILAIPNFPSSASAEQEPDPRLVDAVLCSKAWMFSGI
ncbi:Zinc finger BED domain-containing protein RICESLEEPER 2 [Rhynchospora pubera]|uniref:Zinc finger BED domain-containing protein RICESLEEPER 2 n=1 Tax=Rhynchospora pubera TaxID=906938 RepID=A0AAV8CST6_9POAL|nr:Zinc finger BED domain-containing protein RICESLEEPER 2 [Rhynchospora pubera]